MLELIGKIPDNCIIACSGGPDSMALVDFCNRGKRTFSVAFVHHGTQASCDGQDLVQKWCIENNRNLLIGRIEEAVPSGRSKEEFWRTERYKFFKSFDAPILMAHHLDDVVETWIFSSLNGNPNIIPYRNHKANIIRPLLANRKSELVKWCKNHDVEYVVDKSNNDLQFARNRIRHNIVPEAFIINPGLYKVMKKKIAADAQRPQCKGY